MPVGDKRGRGYELGTTVVQIQIVVRAWSEQARPLAMSIYRLRITLQNYELTHLLQ